MPIALYPSNKIITIVKGLITCKTISITLANMNFSYAFIKDLKTVKGKLNATLKTAMIISVCIMPLSSAVKPWKTAPVFKAKTTPRIATTSPMTVYRIKSIPLSFFCDSSSPKALYFAEYLIIALPKPKSNTVKYTITVLTNPYSPY